MRIAVIGAGHVGLVAAACLAESGHEVVAIDRDEKKIDGLRDGKVPIHEPKLDDLIRKNLGNTLSFSTDIGEVENRQVVFLAVGTPQGEDGAANLESLWSVGEEIAPRISLDTWVVVKSTVPAGTNYQLTQRMRMRNAGTFGVVSNPEFLREGSAVDDFMNPDRVIVGVRGPGAASAMWDVYWPVLGSNARPRFLVMSPESAELTKYAANAFLATKISFMNEIARLCEEYGADVKEVRTGLGTDKRIGFAYTQPGAGWAGSCFGKDLRALSRMARWRGVAFGIVDQVISANDRHRKDLFRKVRDHYFDGLKNKVITVWGLAFKPDTSDTRESVAFTVIDALLAAGVSVRVHDPIADVSSLYGTRLDYCQDKFEALDGADGLLILTEWDEYKRVRYEEFRRMRNPVVFDGRNLYDPSLVASAGVSYYSIGRAYMPGRNP